MGVVYRLDFASGKTYVGITRQDTRRRFAQHASLAKVGQKTALYAAWRKHGAPTMSILCEVPNEQLESEEVRLIDALQTLAPAGYNSTTGGEVSPMLFPEIVGRIAAKKLGSKHADETKARMSMAHIGRVSPNKGKTFGEEWRAKMATAHLGKAHSQATKDKMSASRAAYWARKRAGPNGPDTAV